MWGSNWSFPSQVKRQWKNFRRQFHFFHFLPIYLPLSSSLRSFWFLFIKVEKDTASIIIHFLSFHFESNQTSKKEDYTFYPFSLHLESQKIDKIHLISLYFISSSIPLLSVHFIIFHYLLHPNETYMLVAGPYRLGRTLFLLVILEGKIKWNLHI